MDGGIWSGGISGAAFRQSDQGFSDFKGMRISSEGKCDLSGLSDRSGQQRGHKDDRLGAGPGLYGLSGCQ